MVTNVMLLEPLFHNLSPMNPDIVILGYALAIRKIHPLMDLLDRKKNPLMV